MFKNVTDELLTIVSMKFNDWILNELNNRNWSQADLARNAKLTRGSVSNYINGRIPDDVALRKIARAFELPPETVYRAAGLLPPPIDDPWVDDMSHKISQLTGQRRQMAENLLNSLLEMETTDLKTKPALK